MEMESYELGAWAVRVGSAIYVRLETPDEDKDTGEEIVRIWWFSKGTAPDGVCLQLTAMELHLADPLEAEFQRMKKDAGTPT